MSFAKKLDRPATLGDLDDLPPGWRGEIIDGELYAFPRPRAPHAGAESTLVGELWGPFQRGRGGPGGWWIIAEPGIQIERAPEIAPDVAGWRRDRLPSLPKNEPIRVVPNCVCEILSPSTRGYDLVIKRRFYAEVGVEHLWYVDTEARTLSVSRLHEGKWLELGAYGPEALVRAEPFEAIEIDLAAWWDGMPPPPE